MIDIVSLSLRVSGIALLFSTLIGVPLGATLGLSRFVGRRVVVALLYTGMGFPPVVVGLFVYLMLISGLLILTENPFTGLDSTSYLRIAGFTSLVSFLVSLRGEVFARFLGKAAGATSNSAGQAA